ncbi:hypothetical protein B0H13DRAFT_2359633 [Mycena leptocephala]|nr:hypothetical protein B0H13DRAFT_2359633 [Mycena leptocephala]
MTAVVSAVSAYPVSLSSPRPSATSPSKLCPGASATAAKPTTTGSMNASTPLRHRCAHFHGIALAFSLHILAATLAFVTYTETSKQFDGAVLFASFTLFRLLRQPTMFLPRTLFAIADMHNALARLSLVFRAPLHEGAPFVVDPEQEAAAWVKGVGWVWEEKAKGKKEKEGREKEKQTKRSTHTDPTNHPSLCTTSRSPSHAACSPPSSGAWGAARRWAFGESVVYCPWSAWIQNATVMDSVLFGQPFEEDRYWRVMEDSHLPPDLQPLADGDLTEKQRVNIARALSYGTDVVIFDDPLSAVDANVGKALFRSAIQGLVAQGKTVLLITHRANRGGGHVPELIARGGEFARLDREFGQTKAEDAGGRAARGRMGTDEAQVQVVSFGKDIDTIDNALPNDPHAMHHNDLTEDPAIVAKRTELAQRMKMLEGVRKDLMAFEK